MIRKISYKDELVREIFLTVAEEHYQKKDFAKVVETVSYLKNFHIAEDEDYYLKIVRSYMEQDKLDEAFELLDKKIIHSLTKRDELFSALAQEYYNKKNLELALYCNLYNDNYALQKALYIQIAQDYQKQGDAEALNVLRRIVNHGHLVDVNNSGSVRHHIEKGDFDTALEGIIHSNIR